jgi:ADP-glucose pyrophosphorylase
VQYKSQSLIDHLTGAWRFGGLLRHQFITTVTSSRTMLRTWWRSSARITFTAWISIR